MSEPHPTPPPDHRLKVPHLVFALLFLGLAGIWALVVTDVINEDRLPVIAPALLIGAGVIGLAASLASARNRRHTETVHTAEPEPQPETQYEPEPELEDDYTEEIR